MSLPQVEVLVELRPGILACLDFTVFIDLICLIIFFHYQQHIVEYI